MITVICPVYNEAAYIPGVMDFFVASLPTDKELIIIDGGSDDDTREIVKEYCSRHPQIRLLENPAKFVPFALNKAIQSSKGDPIIRLDAHTTYSGDYFIKILETFSATGSDIVGGPMRSIGKSNFQKGVAIATSTPFGIGDSSFHNESHEGYVDSVYLGAWKRNVFDDTGYFDTDMLRNQDDEFHYRARAMGKKIYLNPQIRSWYYPRNSLVSLLKQYYHYGLFKPLVLKKVKSGMKLRHLIPSAFVCYLLLSLFFLRFPLVYIPLIIYALLALYFSLTRAGSIKVALNMLLIYPSLHLSYGTGFIIGLFLLFLGKKPSI